MADYFDAGKFGGVLSVGPFTNANCTTQESNADLAIGQNDYWVAPAGGSVVGISANLDGALTAGSVTVSAHKAGTEFADSSAPTAVLDATNSAYYGSCRPGAVTFDAGDKLGLSIVTTTTLNPTNTADVDGYLFVQLDAS
jgi:hypothetical protein